MQLQQTETRHTPATDSASDAGSWVGVKPRGAVSWLLTAALQSHPATFPSLLMARCRCWLTPGLTRYLASLCFPYKLGHSWGKCF